MTPGSVVPAPAPVAESRLVAGQRAAIRNRGTLQGGCGCFHCLALFPADTVRAWTDDGATALCPRCGMDAVVPAVSLGFGPAELVAMKRRWFKPWFKPWDGDAAA